MAYHYSAHHRCGPATLAPACVPPLLLLALVAGLRSAAAADQLLMEVEHCSLTGAAQAQNVASASGGAAVWVHGGEAAWEPIVPAGRYRLFVRIRAGWSEQHEYGVQGDTLYSATVDGRPVPLRLVPDTVAYLSDDQNWAWLVGEAGELTQGLHEVRLRATWHWGRWDVVVLSSSQDFTPSAQPPYGPETEPDTALLTPEERRRYEGYSVWSADPETNCAPGSTPAEAHQAERVTLRARQGEHAAAALNATNWLAAPILFQALLLPESPTGPAVPQGTLTLRHAVPLPSPLPEALADALPALDEAGLLTVPPGETRQLWVEIGTRPLSPGRHAWRLRLRPLDAPRRLSPCETLLELHVSEPALPTQHPLTVFLCDYDADHPGMDADMPAHWVNLYHNCSVPSPATPRPDYRAMDERVRREMARPGARGIYFEHWAFRSDDSWKLPAKRKAWVRGTRRWARHVTRALGLRYDQFVLHIYDEQTGPAVDDFIAARAIVREADPRVRVDVTLPPGITLPEVRRMAGSADIWCPFMSLLASREVMDFLRSTGKPIWPYHCAENKRFWPALQYRLWPWQLFQARAQGLFLWTYLSGDPWDGRSWDGGMVFPGPAGIVPSRRWMLLRQGLDDFALLWAAERAGHRAVVQQALTEVLGASDPAPALRVWHDRLVDPPARRAR